MKVTNHFCCAEVKDVAAQRSAIVAGEFKTKTMLRITQKSHITSQQHG